MIKAALSFLERPWVSLIVGTVIGLIGIVISIVLYRKSLDKNELSFLKVEVSILGVSNPSWQEDLEIKYQGIPITRLTAGRTGIWNSGTTTILNEQILINDPLRISVPKGEKLLVCHASAVSRSVLGIKTCKVDETTYRIDFDYLDPGDGFVIHTAQSSPINSIVIAGTVKKIPKEPLQFLPPDRLWSRIVSSTFLPTLIVAGLGFVASFGSNKVIKVYNFTVGSAAYRLTTAAFLIIAILAAVAAAFIPNFFRRQRAARVPISISTDPVLATFLGLKIKKEEQK